MTKEVEIKEKKLNIIKQEIKKSEYIASILFLNATDTLKLINKNINKLLKYTDLPSDQDFIDRINELKKPYIEAAKKEMEKNENNKRENYTEKRLQELQLNQPKKEDTKKMIKKLK